MQRRTFDAYVQAHDEDFRAFAEFLGDLGEDGYHEAYVGIVERKVHAKKFASVSSLVRHVTKLRFIDLKRIEAKRGVTMPLEEVEEAIEYQTELIADVRLAIGKLSLEHQNLIKAVFYDGETLREVAKRTDQSYYRVFTEFEIAKSCLRESLADYAPKVYRIK